MSSNNQKQDQHGVLRVLRTRDEARAFYNKIARVYDFLSESTEEPIRKSGLDQLDVRDGERVLEIGFGTGTSLVELARLVGSDGKVLGVDIADQMLHVARQRLRDRLLEDRVELICGDATTLPYLSDSVDAIFTSFTLELFDTPEIPAVLAEWRRVLRPGGRLVVVSMSKEGENGAIVHMFEWTHKHFPNFLDCRPIFVRQAVRAAGFKIDSAERKTMWVPVEIVLGRKDTASYADK
jgi:demethylmenaquinone methyltransferase/2-methoxy-6-polyprenyl-1,4-benzoquinol methylase